MKLIVDQTDPAENDVLRISIIDFTGDTEPRYSVGPVKYLNIDLDVHLTLTTFVIDLDETKDVLLERAHPDITEHFINRESNEDFIVIHQMLYELCQVTGAEGVYWPFEQD